MGSCLIKLVRGRKVRYLEWSSVVDAPTTYGMTLRELKAHIKFKYGNEGVRELPQRLARLEMNGGCSSMDGGTAEDMIAWNRAGKGETQLTQDQIWDMYVDQTGDIEGTRHNGDEDK